MSMREYKFWRISAVIGLIVWMIMPFANLKVFGIGYIGLAVALISFSIAYSHMPTAFAAIKFSTALSISTMFVLIYYFNLLSCLMAIGVSFLMMSFFTFVFSYVELTEESD